MRQFVFQNAAQVGRYRFQTLNRDAKFAVVQSASPGWRLGDIEESLVGVEDDANAGARLKSELAGQFRVMGLQRRKNLGAQGFRTLRAFVVKGEVSGFALREFALSASFSLGARQKAQNRGVGTQRQGTLPALDCVSWPVCSELRVTKNGQGVRRIGRQTCCAVSIR